MRNIAIAIFSLFILLAFIPPITFAGKILSLQPADIEKLQTAKHRLEAEKRDIKVFRGAPVSAAAKWNTGSDQDECDRTLTWRTLDNASVNFGFDNGDSGAVWFQAPGDLKVLGVRFMPLDFEGNVLIDIFESPFSGYEGEAVDGNGWFTGGTHPTGITSPLGAHVAGPSPITIGTENLEVWNEVMLPTQPEFSAGENFCVSLWFQRTAGWGFATENPYGAPYSLFKYYGTCCGPDDTNAGWFLRSYVLWYEVLVELTGDTPPDFDEVTVLPTSCIPGEDREVCAEITDINCSGGEAGVASAELCYTVDEGEEQCIALIQTSETWCGTIPGQSSGSVITYYYRATDANGLTNTTISYTYSIWEATAPTLVVYNTNDYPSWIDFYYMLGANNLCGIPYDYDWWYVPSLGPVSGECLVSYDNILWIDGSFPLSDMPINGLADWMDAGTVDDPHNLFISSQDYGCWWYGCEDVAFEPGNFEYDYLGLATLAPQDVGGGIEDPYFIDPVCADALFGYLCGPGQLNYWPGGELNFTNWIDNLQANGNGIVCFTDPTTGNDCGVRVEGDDFNTVFLPFDVLALDWLEPDYDWIVPNYNLFDAFLDQFYFCCGNNSPPELHLLKADSCVLCALDANHIFIKPDTTHRVCVYIDNLCIDYDIETLHFMLTWDAAIQFTDPAGPTFECTDFDSSGWDMKYHIYPDGGSGEDSLEVWLIVVGNAQHPLSEPGCILYIDFRTYPDLAPGLEDTIHFEYAEFNEAGPLATFDFFKTINRPPVVSWEGEDAPDTIDAIYMQECHYYEFLVDAHDYDIDCNHPNGDVILLWAQTDTLCPWSESATFCGRKPLGGPPYIIPPFTGEGYVDAAFKFHPPKLGDCDTFWVDFIAMSTHTTGQPLYDTLSVLFIVEDCGYQFAWTTPPPHWDNPDGNPPLPTSSPYYDVYACQQVEIPVGMHFDYDYILDDPIWSVQVELLYDNRLEVFEVGNEGLITEHIGLLTSNIIPDYTAYQGKIIVSMAFNYPLQWPPHPMPPDPGNLPYGFEVCNWYKMLYVGFQIPDDLPDSTFLGLSIEESGTGVNEGEIRSCLIPSTFLHVRDFSLSGNIYYSDTCIPISGVTVSTVDECGGTIGGIDITDDTGAFYSKPPAGCTAFCIEPSKSTERDVWQQVVTSYDATLVLRALIGDITLSHNDSLAADVSGDGTISGFDASILIKWVVTNYASTGLIPNEIIGTWIFESIDCDSCGRGPWGPSCRCYDFITENDTLCFEGILVGDVSQNWPGPSPKVAADGIRTSCTSTVMTVNFTQPVTAVDMKLNYDAELRVIDVTTASGLVEWTAQANELIVAAASAYEFNEMTITFEKIVPTIMDIIARADEGRIMSTSTRVVPLPIQYNLAQNYPNPFNPVTTIEYALPQASKVKIEVYNVIGQKIATLVNSKQGAGYHTVTWDASDVSSGVYFYRLTADDFSQTRRMVLMK